MSFVDGFLMAVSEEKKDVFIDHAKMTDSIFMELGALRVVECWEADVPDGTQTDFRKAVQLEPGERVVFSWIEWPDQATRDVAMSKMQTLAETDERFDAEKHPVPFDGMRMVFGGFTPVVDMQG